MRALFLLSILGLGVRSVVFWKPSMIGPDESGFPALGNDEDKYHLDLCKMYQFRFENHLKKLFESIEYWAKSNQFTKTFVCFVKDLIYPKVRSEFNEVVESWKELITKATISMKFLNSNKNAHNREKREKFFDSYLDATVETMVDKYLDHISKDNEESLKRDSGKEGKETHWFIKLDFSLQKETEKELNKIDHQLLGGFFAELAYSNGFACLQIQRLSQVIYQLSRVGFLKGKRLEDFLQGFMEGLLEPRNTEDEQKIRKKLLNRFISFNLLMFFESEDKDYNVILGLLNKEPEMFIKDFKNIYNILMNFAVEYDMNIDNNIPSFTLENTKALLERGLKEGLVLTTMLGISFAKGKTLDTIPFPAGFLAEYLAVDNIVSYIDEAMRKRLGIYKSPESQETRKVIGSGNSAPGNETTDEELSKFFTKVKDNNIHMTTANLHKFTESFNEMVCTAEGCKSCESYALMDYSVYRII